MCSFVHSVLCLILFRFWICASFKLVFCFICIRFFFTFFCFSFWIWPLLTAYHPYLCTHAHLVRYRVGYGLDLDNAGVNRNVVRPDVSIQKPWFSIFHTHSIIDSLHYNIWIEFHFLPIQKCVRIVRCVFGLFMHKRISNRSDRLKTAGFCWTFRKVHNKLELKWAVVCYSFVNPIQFESIKWRIEMNLIAFSKFSIARNRTHNLASDAIRFSHAGFFSWRNR